MSARTYRAIERPCELCWSQPRPAHRTHRRPASGHCARTELPASHFQTRPRAWAHRLVQSAASRPLDNRHREMIHPREARGSSVLRARGLHHCLSQCRHRPVHPTPGSGVAARPDRSSRLRAPTPPMLLRRHPMTGSRSRWTSTSQASQHAPTSSLSPTPLPPCSPTLPPGQIRSRRESRL